MAPRRNFVKMFGQHSAYLALLVIAVSIVLDMIPRGGPWCLVAGLSLALAALFAYWPDKYPDLYLALEAGLVIALALFNPLAVMLFTIASVDAVWAFRNRKSVLWITAFAAAGALLLLLSGVVEGWTGVLLTGLGLGVGFGSMGYFTWTRLEAEKARRETVALLDELQQAHRQLQAYAGQVEELAVIDERNRLARELHDTLGHRLAVAAVQLEGAQRLIPTRPEQAGQMVGTVREQVAEALKELRQVVAALRSPVETGLPLPLALQRLTTSFEEPTGIRVHLQVPNAFPPVSDAYKLTLYRLVQEGLTNVQRHAQAKDVWVELWIAEHQICVQVRDNGRGLETTDEQGFGLRGLSERAGHLGGSLQLTPAAGGGSQLSLTLPLPKEAQDA